MSSNYFKLGVATAGIYACYLAYGIFQETLYKVQEDGSVFAATAFLMMFQCVVNALLSLVVDAYKTAGDKDQWKWIGTLTSKEVVGTSIVYVSAMYMSNEALQYVSYPTQALAKSCKMIPVLIGRVFINGERYGWMKYVCVLLMTIGIAMFQMWGGKKKGGSHGAAPVEGFGGEGYGMFLLVISLVFDGIGGPFQEKLKGMHLSNTQQIVVNNVWAAALMMLVSLFYGEFWSALSYIRTHPAILQALVAFSMCSAVGQIFIFWTIREFDSLTLSTITTTRKFFTIVASVFVHGNLLNPWQWVAVGVVFSGLAIEVAESERDRRSKKRAHANKT